MTTDSQGIGAGTGGAGATVAPPTKLLGEQLLHSAAPISQ